MGVSKKSMPFLGKGDALGRRNRGVLGGTLVVSGGGGGGAGSLTVGGLTKAGVALISVAATAVSSGSYSAYFAVSAGHLVPTAAFDAANLSSGTGTVGLNDGNTLTVTIEANTYDVSTQAEYDAIANMTNFVAAVGGSIALVNAGPWDIKMDDFGPGMAQTRYVQPFVIKSRNPLTAKAQLTYSGPEATVYLRNSDRVELYDLTFPVGTHQKVTRLNSNYTKIHRCDFTGVLNAAATTGALWANQEFLADDGGSGLEVIDNSFRYCNAALTTFADNVIVRGNLVMDWWAVGMHFVVRAEAKDMNWVVEQNVFVGPWAKSSDVDGSHPDTILFTGTASPLATIDTTTSVKMNRFVQGGRRGDFIGITHRDATGTHVFKATVVGNVMAGAETVETITIEDGRDCVVAWNTTFGRGTGPTGSQAAMTICDGRSYGTHQVHNNLCERINGGGAGGGVISDVNNVKLGFWPPAATVLTAVDGPTIDMSSFASTLADVMSNFNMKASGPAALNGGNAYGAIGSGAVQWATTVPGHDGVMFL